MEIVPVSADGEAVRSVPLEAEEGGEAGLFYPGSVALRVSVSDTVPDGMYLLTVSAGEDVLYADQRTGETSVVFDVSFTLPERRTDLLLSIGSSAPDFERLTVPLSYTPGTKTGYALCAGDEACPLASYSDLDRSAWYHDGVHFVLEKGIMNGVGDGSFAPNGTASRAMLVTMLWRMEGQPESDLAVTFGDVPEDLWFTGAVRWAASARIVDGYSAESFGPNDNVSREQLAVILWRYAAYKGIASPANEINLGVFLDAERISPWAREGVKWAIGAEMLTGVGEEKLSPETNATRAQVATMLMRYTARVAETGE